MDRLLDQNNKEFVKKMLQKNPRFFEELSQGQNPDYFVLACSDSRVSPDTVLNMPLGHMFMHRNIANQVNQDDDSFTASLTYALKYLKVKKVVIKGHTGCGGIRAAVTGNDDEDLQGWLAHIRDSLPTDVDNLSEAEQSKLNVRYQMDLLRNHPIYQKYGEGVDIIGLVFHLETGELEQII